MSSFAEFYLHWVPLQKIFPFHSFVKTICLRVSFSLNKSGDLLFLSQNRMYEKQNRIYEKQEKQRGCLLTRKQQLFFKHKMQNFLHFFCLVFNKIFTFKVQNEPIFLSCCLEFFNAIEAIMRHYTKYMRHSPYFFVSTRRQCGSNLQQRDYAKYSWKLSID